MLEFLCDEIKTALKYENLRFIYEIRIRANKPITVNKQGEYLYLTHYGVSKDESKAIIVGKEEIAEIVFAAGKYSIYSVEDQLKMGFITAEYGERIGIGGRFVFEKGVPIAIRDFSSVCIRVPHEIIGCANKIYERCFQQKICNVLIAAPPGLGKTTILRDLCRIICKNTKKNLLICDERGELGVGDIGDSSDIISFADKKTAFETGIRVMRPEIIVTDELSEDDCKYVKRAKLSGVKVIASAHFSRKEELYAPYLDCFDKYIFLNEEKLGEIYAVFDNCLKETDL
jgi:stage III sporulation protein AA